MIISVDEIHVLPSRRAIDEETVASLATSMRDIGLQHPITVRYADDGHEAAATYILVAGRHRLEGARRLGWDVIDGICQDWDERQARMWEISENLHRRT